MPAAANDTWAGSWGTSWATSWCRLFVPVTIVPVARPTWVAAERPTNWEALERPTVWNAADRPPT